MKPRVEKRWSAAGDWAWCVIEDRIYGFGPLGSDDANSDKESRATALRYLHMWDSQDAAEQLRTWPDFIYLSDPTDSFKNRLRPSFSLEPPKQDPRDNAMRYLAAKGIDFYEDQLSAVQVMDMLVEYAKMFEDRYNDIFSIHFKSEMLKIPEISTVFAGEFKNKNR